MVHTKNIGIIILIVRDIEKKREEGDREKERKGP